MKIATHIALTLITYDIKSSRVTVSYAYFQIFDKKFNTFY